MLAWLVRKQCPLDRVLTVRSAFSAGTVLGLQPGQAYTAATGGSFGQIQQTVESAVGLGAQRQIQLSLRFSF